MGIESGTKVGRVAGHIPQPDGGVIGSGSEGLPIGTERHASDSIRVVGEGGTQCGRVAGHIPQIDGIVPIRRGSEGLPIGTERDD